MIKHAEFKDPNEERVYGYLRQMLSTFESQQLRHFLRFVTGSTVCTSMTINVSFNKNTDAARRPIPHTCDPLLELNHPVMTRISSLSTSFEYISTLTVPGS